MTEFHYGTLGPGQSTCARACPLCVWIDLRANGLVPIEHPHQPFCNRCMDDLAALIKQRRAPATAQGWHGCVEHEKPNFGCPKCGDAVLTQLMERQTKR